MNQDQLHKGEKEKKRGSILERKMGDEIKEN